MERLKKVIYIDTHPLILGETYYLDISSIMGDSDGDWSGLIYKDNKITEENLKGRYYLKHFKSFGR